MEASKRAEYTKKIGSLNNHPANLNQDHLTITGFFTTETEFLAHIAKLELNVKEYEFGVMYKISIGLGERVYETKIVKIKGHNKFRTMQGYRNRLQAKHGVPTWVKFEALEGAN